jgi:hypothetical protein
LSPTISISPSEEPEYDGEIDDDEDEYCSSKQDLLDAIAVAEKIGVDIEELILQKNIKKTKPQEETHPSKSPHEKAANHRQSQTAEHEQRRQRSHSSKQRRSSFLSGSSLSQESKEERHQVYQQAELENIGR